MLRSKRYKLGNATQSRHDDKGVCAELNRYAVRTSRKHDSLPRTESPEFQGGGLQDDKGRMLHMSVCACVRASGVLVCSGIIYEQEIKKWSSKKPKTTTRVNACCRWTSETTVAVTRVKPYCISSEPISPAFSVNPTLLTSLLLLHLFIK